MLELLDTLGRLALPMLAVPLAVWTLLYPLGRGLLRTAAFDHPDARYYGHLALLAGLPLGIAVAAAIQLTGWHPPQVTVPMLALPAVDATATTSPAPAAPTWTGWHLLGGAVLLWSLAALTLLVQLGLRWRATQTAFQADGVRVPAWLADQVAAGRQQHGIRRAVRVVLTPRDTVPMTLGVRRPVIVLPAALLDDRRALALALTHELTHIARLDCAVHAVEAMIEAVFFWHPVVRRLCRDLPGYRELACDGAVLDRHRRHAKPYASLLLRFASQRPEPTLSALSMADSPMNLKARIQTMMTPVNTSPLHRRFGLVLGLVLFALSGLVVACTDMGNLDDAEEPAAQQTAARADLVAEVDEMPELIGGLASVAEKIQYPEEAKDLNVEGRVIVQFVVTQDGAVEDVQVVKGIGAGCDDEALRVTKTLKFVPAKKDGAPVNTQLTLPITFRLSNETVPRLQVVDLEVTDDRISGRVLTPGGEPLSKANVVLAGTTLGAATHSDGRFVLRASDRTTDVLQVSAPAYEPVSVRLK